MGHLILPDVILFELDKIDDNVDDDVPGTTWTIPHSRSRMMLSVVLEDFSGHRSNCGWMLSLTMAVVDLRT